MFFPVEDLTTQSCRLLSEILLFVAIPSLQARVFNEKSSDGIAAV